MTTKKIFLCYLLYAFCIPTVAQVSAESKVNDKIAQQIAAFVENSGEEGEFDFNTLYEQYEILQENPINLNNATRADLQEILFLSEIQISNLLEHRRLLGDLRTIYELQTIPGFDIETIRLLREIARVQISLPTTRRNLRSSIAGANHTVYLKWKRFIETQAGFRPKEEAPPNFLGDPNHLYLRYKMNVGNDIKMGFIAEKDYGEPYFYPGKTYGADYFSFHAYGKDIHPNIRFIALGDYAISLGQGLIMHSGFGAGKSTLTTNVRKGGYTVRSYSSVAEMNFLRGFALTTRLGKNWEWTNFASSKRRNSGVLIQEDTPFDGEFVSSLPLGGLNRTESEIARKNLFRQTTAGSSIKYKMLAGHIAIQSVYDRFNVNFLPGNALYQLYFPQGSQFINTSVDYGYNWRNINFFGEIATDKNLAISQLHGLLIGLDKTLDYTFVFRNYSPKYRSFTANAFGESPIGSNETGIYMGLEYRPSKQWVINAYADVWRNPWAKFRVDGPGLGKEYLMKIRYFKKRKWELYTQYFYEQKPRNFNDRIDAPLLNTRQRLRFHGSILLAKGLTLRNRVEFSWYEEARISDYGGFLVYQDILYKPTGENYSFNFRYAFFDIEDFDSRIYAFENDILNEYYIPAYNGRGLRFYINTRWRLNRHITTELRYEITRLSEPFVNEEGERVNLGFGSGNTRIDGRNRSQIKAQVKYKF